MGVGQFCTNPGLVFVIGPNSSVDTFVAELVKSIASVPPAVMLTNGILKNYQSGLEDFKKVSGVKLEHHVSSDKASAAVFSVSYSDFIARPERLQKEIFGPSTLVIKVDTNQDLLKIPAALAGQLTATFHATEVDTQSESVKQLIRRMGERVGRLVWGGYPTGVEVNTAMHHAGPWPASSDGGRTTSVGTRAILRFVRPVAFQNFPEPLLPPELVDGNPKKIIRMVAGKIVVP